MDVVCLCVKTLLIEKHTDESFSGSFHPRPLHISPVTYFWGLLIPMIVTSPT